MFCVVLLELLCVEAELFIPLNFWNALSVVRRVNSISIVWTVSNVVTFDLAPVADVVCRQFATSSLDGRQSDRQPRFHELENRVTF